MALLMPMALIEKSAGARADVPCRANGGHDSHPCDSQECDQEVRSGTHALFLLLRKCLSLQDRRLQDRCWTRLPVRSGLAALRGNGILFLCLPFTLREYDVPIDRVIKSLGDIDQRQVKRSIEPDEKAPRWDGRILLLRNQ